eukprot:1195118-Prorocentrum_minimum.AAC.3
MAMVSYAESHKALPPMGSGRVRVKESRVGSPQAERRFHGGAERANGEVAVCTHRRCFGDPLLPLLLSAPAPSPCAPTVPPCAGRSGRRCSAAQSSGESPADDHTPGVSACAVLACPPCQVSAPVRCLRVLPARCRRLCGARVSSLLGQSCKIQQPKMRTLPRRRCTAERATRRKSNQTDAERKDCANLLVFPCGPRKPG